MKHAIAILALGVLAGQPASAQSNWAEQLTQMSQKGDYEITLISDTCLGMFYVQMVDKIGGPARKELVVGCDGAFFVKSDIDGTGPIRELDYAGYGSSEAFGYRRDVEISFRSYSDPKDTCMIRIASLKHFAPGQVPADGDYEDGPRDPTEPTRKIKPEEVPPECVKQPIS